MAASIAKGVNHAMKMVGGWSNWVFGLCTCVAVKSLHCVSPIKRKKKNAQRKHWCLQRHKSGGQTLALSEQVRTTDSQGNVKDHKTHKAQSTSAADRPEPDFTALGEVSSGESRKSVLGEAT
eukprot:3651280-Amphidinium_carterae.1